MKKNYSIYNLPENVIFCKKCVVSNQRPQSTIEFKSSNNQKKGIKFGKDGICDACKYNDKKKVINWKEREKKLFHILEKYRKNNGDYDCIVPSSGGKDSSFTAHILKNKYKMNPLAVTWAPNMWTEVGLNNFQNLSRVGGVDSFLYTPNGNLHRYLTKKAFLNLGHPFQPFMHGQKIIGPKIASQLNISLVIYGENQAEYGNDIKDNEDFLMNSDFYSCKDDQDITEIKIAGSSIKEIINDTDFQLNDFTSYIPLKKSVISNKKISMLYLGYFEKWDPQECFYYASQNTGFKPASERSEGTYSKYTEIDDKMVPFHFYTTFIKFGIGRATHDASQEIRNNKINRDEGVKLVKKFDSEEPNKYLKEFLQYLDISKDQYLKTIDSFRSPHLWNFDEKSNKWQLKKTVF
tara:strand:- start:3346 stop:4563 length:1218 start_codon:yes stop_codon:yes gene_type:complete